MVAARANGNEQLAVRDGRATKSSVMFRIAAIALLAALPLFASGCGESTGAAPSGGPTVGPSVGTATAVTIAVSARVSASAVAPQSSKLSGSWRGAFESKKAAVTLDPGVKESAWSADDGKAHAGKGEIDLQVAEDGVVAGKLSGALGSATIAGSAEGETLTMTFVPTDADSSESISGVIVLQLKDSKLSGDLKASSGDASFVRAATLELTRSES